MTTPGDWDDPEFDAEDGEARGDLWASDIVDVVDDGDQGPQLALLSDGSALRLTGPGAGSVVESDSIPHASVHPTIRTRDEALNGRPLLLVHRAYRGGGVLPRLLAGILAATGGQISLGTVTPLPRSTAPSSTGWLSDCAASSVRIADPLGFLLDGAVVSCKPPSERAQRWWSYLASNPLDPVAVLDAQRQAGANLLLSSGRAIDPADSQNGLDRIFADADETLAQLQGGERLALNLTLPRQWLSRPALRDQLLAHLLDQEQFDVWYIRVQWPSSLRSTEQPLDVDLLQGYKRLAQLAADEERTLLLPQAGLTGWFQLAFGATGFGSGLPGSDQAFKELIGGGAGATPIERYFEPGLLHSVERTVHDALRKRDGYINCACPYCPALHAAADWRHDLAALHQLHCLGHLTADAAETTRGGAGGYIRRAVRTAINTAAGEPLAGLSEPRHLAVWDRLL